MLSIKREMEWKLSQDEVENSAELVRVHLLSIELLANELSDYFKMLANERNQAKSELKEHSKQLHLEGSVINLNISEMWKRKLCLRTLQRRIKSMILVKE